MSKKFNVNDIVHERKNELDSSPLFQAQSQPQSVQEEAASTPLPDRDQGDAQVILPSPFRVPVEKLEKYTTHLEPSLIKKVKLHAAEQEMKDYQVIRNALLLYFEKNR
jgi:hypothetical protein